MIQKFANHCKLESDAYCQKVDFSRKRLFCEPAERKKCPEMQEGWGVLILLLPGSRVRIIRTESRGAFWLNIHHYPSTDAVPGVIGPVLEIILRFPGPIPLEGVSIAHNPCPCELNLKIPVKLPTKSQCSDHLEMIFNTAELVLGGVMDWV